MQDPYQLLQSLGIKYTEYPHPAIFTVEEGEQYKKSMPPGGHTKNLFLRNKKGDQHYLVVIEGHKKADLGFIKKLTKESKLSFASPERLQRYLCLTPGSVTPMGLIYESAKEVNVIIDADLLEYDTVFFHPNINTATIGISSSDFQKYLEWTKCNVRFVKL